MRYSITTIGYKSLNNIINRLNEAYSATLPPTEFIVVINNYSSESLKILEHVSKDPRVTRWAFVSQNIGCAKAFNIGFSLCKEDVMVALSDDCSVFGDTYRNMVSEFLDPKVGVVGVEYGGNLSNDKWDVAKGYLVAYRKSMIDSIGGYDESFSPLADERELGLKAQFNGWSLKIAQNCQWQHYFDISSKPHTIIDYMGEKIIPAEFVPRTYPKLQAKINNYNQ